MTFNELKNKINKGEIKVIYLSSSSLWFTHDVLDVRKATRLGKKAQKKLLKEHLSNPDIPEKDKKLIKKLVAKSKDLGINLDREGNPLIINSNPKEWIKNVEKRPMHFGKHTFRAFMFTHAKNCGEFEFQNWKEVTNRLDEIENISKNI